MVARVRRTCVGAGRIRNSRVRNRASEGHEDRRSSKTGQTRSSVCAPVALKRRTALRGSITATTQEAAVMELKAIENGMRAREAAHEQAIEVGASIVVRLNGRGFSALSRVLALEALRRRVS